MMLEFTLANWNLKIHLSLTEKPVEILDTIEHLFYYY